MGLRLPILLAARLGQIVWIVDDPYHNQTLPVRRKIRDVDAKRSVTALVFAGLNVIDPDGSREIDRAKVEDPTSPCLGKRQLTTSPIPARMQELGSTYPTRRRLGGKWNVNLLGPCDAGRAIPRAVSIGCEIPAAIQ
jgi:hypothetical protein